MTGSRRLLVSTLVVAGVAAPATAQGHGPVYGLSTPTLGRGGWSLDTAGMARWFDGGSTAMVRPMLSYGATEDLQLSLSVPVPVARDGAAPVVRGPTRMPMVRDAELMIGWRPHRTAVGVGARFETTIWLAADVPLDGTRGGLATAPGIFASAVTGYASRSVYLWVGVAYRHPFTTADAEHRAGSTTIASLVVGYRPERFRDDYPHPDWRAFVEVVAERVGPATVDGARVTDSGGRQLYMAPTALGLFGAWGIAGGPAFPVAQSLNGDQPDDGARLAINVTFWF